MAHVHSECDLSWLIAPIELRTFVSEYWSQRPMRVSRQDPRYLDRLMSEDDLEFVLYAAAKHGNRVEILKGNESPIPCHSHAAAVDAYKAGYSLRIVSVNAFLPTLTALTRGIEQHMSGAVNVNMYLSPGASKALDLHFDSHDVIVAQIFGEKQWQLFSPPSSLPLENLPGLWNENTKDMRAHRLKLSHAQIRVPPELKLEDEFTLSPGDCLYVPRGIWHQAHTAEGCMSCHLTIGLQTFTYLDLLSVWLGEHAADQRLLREALPFGFATRHDVASVINARLTPLLSSLEHDFDSSQAIATIIASLTRNHRTSLDNDLVSISSQASRVHLRPSSILKRRRSMYCYLTIDAGVPELLFAQKRLRADPRFTELCSFVASTNDFRLSDLPGSLSIDERMDFVSELIDAGLLTTSDLGESGGPKAGWIPTNVDMAEKLVTWTDFSTTRISEPFFHQTVDRQRRHKHRSEKRPLTMLADVPEDLPIKGFIFHISRCGSTLLSNGLNQIPGVIVISEAETISTLLAAYSEQATLSADETCDIDAALKGLIRSYGQRTRQSDIGVVIKFSSWNILFVEILTRLWPMVPVAVVVRDPIEVVASCLRSMPNWFSWLGRPELRKKLLGFPDAGPDRPEVWCARVIEKFLLKARELKSSQMLVMDYTELDIKGILKVAAHFSLDTKAQGAHDMISASMRSYSKTNTDAPFTSDSSAKQKQITGELRSYIERHVSESYNALLAKNDVVD